MTPPVTIVAQSSDGPIFLRGASTRITLSTVVAGPARAQLTKLANSTLYLSFHGLRVSQGWATVFNVYMNLPDGVAPPSGVKDVHYVGTLSTFDALKPSDRALNVTSSVRQLVAEGAIQERLTVTLVRSGNPAGEGEAEIASVQMIVR